jgi:hypothetical protein
MSRYQVNVQVAATWAFIVLVGCAFVGGLVALVYFF